MPPTSTMRMLRTLLLALAVLLFGSGAGSAQQSDADQVKAALAALQAAIGSLDMAKMEPLWVPDANIMLINPRAKAVSIGWDQAKKNWQAVFDDWSAHASTSRARNATWRFTCARLVRRCNSTRSSSEMTNSALGRPRFAMPPYRSRAGYYW